MAAPYKPPLAVHLVWHPSDKDSVDPIIQAVSKHLSRDVDRPFSRNLNIPLFFYSSDSPDTPPGDSPQGLAARDILFVFTSVNTRGREAWNDYIQDLPCGDSFRCVPVALDSKGFGHGEEGSLKGLNFLRAYDWPEKFRAQHAILALAHEIYRHGFVEIEEGGKGKDSSIKIFLSHAKSGDTGLRHAESIKDFIENTNMSHFFDATEISAGFSFDDEIIGHLKESTVLAIGSDAYSSRYWCQREILCAKEHQRPMIAVDCLEEHEDRIFPAGANIPCVHVAPEPPLGDADILRILIAAILETIRHHHALESLKYYQSQGWIDSDCSFVSRPPEIRQLPAFGKGQKTKVCYPEPPIYSEEADWHHQLGIEAFTPLWRESEHSPLDGRRVGISISDVPNDGFSHNHLHADQSIRLAQDLARHLLARSATLIYGGDLRRDGFTDFILQEAIALKNRLNTDTVHVENHLAWPLYRSGAEIVAWRANYKAVMKTVEHVIPNDIIPHVDKDKFLPPSTPQNKYIWSRCLTEMREKSIDSSHARICAGGRLSEYKGKMPGVLEEILIALDRKKPIYLLGGFGGVVGEVCKVLRDEPYPEPLTEAWQITHNEGYSDLQKIARDHDRHADYDSIKSTLKGIELRELADGAGLDEEEYSRLMQTPFVDECVHIVIRGLKK
uniref:TIR domain-containing protein n=1 Tax=Candidatus Kentrum sp. SD TaxID=2126332 RepID=A0A450Y965_9GAMM|nr:MAG: TIR domain-containing protein [Candidatus Kentron sp. SD]VFK42826.1 MAG: TIR domain-containing protein [Candidatus Kentron sp. SD]